MCHTRDGRGFAQSWRQFLEQLVRDKELHFLKDVLSAVFDDLNANATIPMGPERTPLDRNTQIQLIEIVVLYALRADLNTMNPNNAPVLEDRARLIEFLFDAGERLAELVRN